MSNNKRLNSFNDCFRHGVHIRIRCWQCGRTRIVQNGLDSLFREKGIATNLPVLTIRRKIKCGQCGAREPHVELTMP